VTERVAFWSMVASLLGARLYFVAGDREAQLREPAT
jgi:prolipoprotein diacylglyceryltransferase